MSLEENRSLIRKVNEALSEKTLTEHIQTRTYGGFRKWLRKKRNMKLGKRSSRKTG